MPKNGAVSLPEGPGLVVTLDPTALARCHQRYLDDGPFPSGVKGMGYGAQFKKI